MQASAIIVIGNHFASAAVCDFPNRPASVTTSCLEILGRSVLELTVERLRHAGIQAISVIAEESSAPLLRDRDLEIVTAGRTVDRWPRAGHKLKAYAAQGIEEVLLMELGAYAECDFREVLQSHCSARKSLTQLQDSRQPLDFWIVNAAAIRTLPGDCPLPFGPDSGLGPSAPCLVKGYVNRLANAADLRRLVVGAFLGRCAIRPRGREVRPGVWIDDGARRHRTARLVAPAYLGRDARMGRSAVVARFSNVERNCHVGEGTVVDSASVLSHTTLGRGLDVSQAVVHGNEFVDLGRNLAIKIDDPNLIRDTAPRPRRLSRRQREQVGALDGRNQPFELEGSLQGEV